MGLKTIITITFFTGIVVSFYTLKKIDNFIEKKKHLFYFGGFN